METKTCCKCKETKPLDAFYRDKKAKDRHGYRCKKCMDIVTRKNYLKYYTPKRENLYTEDGQKICKVCREKKSLSEFNKHTKSQNLRTECRICQRKWSHDYYKANAVEERLKRKIYHKQNPEKSHAWMLKKYGLTLEDYKRMLESQNGQCAICGIDKGYPKSGRRFAVDHDHETGKVRALLCGNCNTGISHFKHDPDLMEKAIDYLLTF